MNSRSQIINEDNKRSLPEHQPTAAAAGCSCGEGGGGGDTKTTRGFS